MTPDGLRKTLDGKRTDGMRLSAHLRETVAAPWLDPDGKPGIFKDAEDCDLSWRSLLEHEAIEVEALEDAGYAAADAWEKDQDALMELGAGTTQLLTRIEAQETKAKKVVDTVAAWKEKPYSMSAEALLDIIVAALAGEEKP